MLFREVYGQRLSIIIVDMGERAASTESCGTALNFICDYRLVLDNNSAMIDDAERFVNTPPEVELDISERAPTLKAVRPPPAAASMVTLTAQRELSLIW
jgi:hypothetical protein